MSAKPSVALPILWFTKHRDKAVTFIKNFLISLEHDQSHHDKIRRLMIELKKKKNETTEANCPKRIHSLQASC